jgi:hypothetical protein
MKAIEEAAQQIAPRYRHYRKDGNNLDVLCQGYLDAVQREYKALYDQ